MLLLSSHGDLFDVLFKPPKPTGTMPSRPAAADKPTPAPDKKGGE
jgi:hypothetical protein